MASRRGKMDIADRAKQFMPFDALKGFREALLEKERIIVPKKECSEEHNNELDMELSQIQQKDIIILEYFEHGEYIRMTGMVSRIDRYNRKLEIANKQINFDDILNLSRNSHSKRDVDLFV